MATSVAAHQISIKINTETYELDKKTLKLFKSLMALNSTLGGNPQIVFHAPIFSAVKRALIPQLLITSLFCFKSCWKCQKEMRKASFFRFISPIKCHFDVFQKQKCPKHRAQVNTRSSSALGASLWSIVAVQVATFSRFWKRLGIWRSLFGRSEAACKINK